MPRTGRNFPGRYPRRTNISLKGLGGCFCFSLCSLCFRSKSFNTLNNGKSILNAEHFFAWLVLSQIRTLQFSTIHLSSTQIKSKAVR